MLRDYTAIRDKMAADITAALSLPDSATIWFGTPTKVTEIGDVVVFASTEVSSNSVRGRSITWTFQIYHEFTPPAAGVDVLGVQVEKLQALADQLMPTTETAASVGPDVLYAGVARNAEVVGVEPGVDDDSEDYRSILLTFRLVTDTYRA